MQNSGLGNSINPLVSILSKNVYKIPIILFTLGFSLVFISFGATASFLGSVILNNCKIGLNTIIGANSTVTKNCKKNTTYVGSPVRKIKSRRLSDNYL